MVKFFIALCALFGGIYVASRFTHNLLACLAVGVVACYLAAK